MKPSNTYPAKKLSFTREWFPPSRDGLDIKVTPKNINRALLFMDTLIKALRARKHEIILKNGFTYASIKEQEFRICFREKTKGVIVPGKHYDSSEYHPVNILYFKYEGYSSKEWKDGKRPLENYLPEIVSKLEIASAELTFEQENHRKYFGEIERKHQAVIDAQQLKENELSEFKDLLIKAERWQKVHNFRNYLAAVEKTIGQNDAPDDLLKDIDRRNLSLKDSHLCLQGYYFIYPEILIFLVSNISHLVSE